MKMDHWKNDTDRKTEVHGEKPVGVKLCLHKSHMDWPWIDARPPHYTC